MIARLDQRTKQLPIDTSRWFPAFGPGRTARPANFCHFAPLTISNGARQRDLIVAQWILQKLETLHDFAGSDRGTKGVQLKLPELREFVAVQKTAVSLRRSQLDVAKRTHFSFLRSCARLTWSGQFVGADSQHDPGHGIAMPAAQQSIRLSALRARNPRRWRSANCGERDALFVFQTEYQYSATAKL